jgi:hypothetical protein
MPAFQDGDLLPKHKIFRHKPPLAAKKVDEYAKPEQKQVVDEPGL